MKMRIEYKDPAAIKAMLEASLNADDEKTNLLEVNPQKLPTERGLSKDINRLNYLRFNGQQFESDKEKISAAEVKDFLQKKCEFTKSETENIMQAWGQGCTSLLTVSTIINNLTWNKIATSHDNYKINTSLYSKDDELYIEVNLSAIAISEFGNPRNIDFSIPVNIKISAKFDKKTGTFKYEYFGFDDYSSHLLFTNGQKPSPEIKEIIATHQKVKEISQVNTLFFRLNPKKRQALKTLKVVELDRKLENSYKANKAQSISPVIAPSIASTASSPEPESGSGSELESDDGKKMVTSFSAT